MISSVAILELANSLLDSIQSLYLSHPRTLFAVIIFALYLLYYLNNAVKQPLLFCADGRFRWFLVANCETLSQYYWPTIWCYETHLLTPIATFIRGLLPKLKYHREYVRTFDNGQISLDWYDPEATEALCSAPGGMCGSPQHSNFNAPIAIFMPGLTGDSQAEYIKTMVPIAAAKGFRVCTINYRGLGNTRLLTPRLYCAANDEDLRAALLHIRAMNPQNKIVAVGVSLGGIIIARYLISTGMAALIDASFLISVVWNFKDVAEQMEKGLNYPLTKLLTNALISIVDEHQHWFEGRVDLEAVRRARSITEFDSAFTCPIYNFKSPGEYYKEASHKGKIAAIKVPTFCINAADDMFAPGDTLPVDEVAESSHVAMLVTARGGHIGFMEGLTGHIGRRPFPGYSERILDQYLGALCRLDNWKVIN